jgi:hypothetical protein
MAKNRACEVKPEQKAPEKPLKRIAVVGCSDTKILAPYDDTSWDIWAMNNAFVHTKRHTKWFEIHPIKYDKGKFYRRELIKPGVFKWADNFRGQPMGDYMQSLANLNVPVFMQKHWDVVPMSVEYPLQEIVAKFGNYFTNSVSYMIAMAIKEIIESGGKGEIGCWGVDMATQSEYGPQRPSCEFFLGIAAGMGIPITIPAEADLLKTRFLYGFQEREQVAWEAKVMSILHAMEKRRNDAQAKFELTRNQIQQYMGAEQAIKEVQRIWSNLQDPKIWRDAS